MNSILKFTCLALCLHSALGLYEGYKSYDVTPNAAQIESFLEWRDVEGVDFWRAGAAGTTSRLMVPPSAQAAFEQYLTDYQLDWKIHHEDVGEIDKEFAAERVKRLAAKKAKSAIANLASPNFEVYWTSEEINDYCIFLALNYPQLVEREVIATSFNGQPIFALKISMGGFGNKPIIFIDGGMHAREWVSQATVVYFLHRMIEDPGMAMELLSEVDWIIIPNLNPDGYTWSYNVNRMWRQNRHQINATCVGVDLNRNWRYSWRPPNPNTCGSLVYGGETPLSEVESSAMNNYMTRYRPNVRMYMSVHSFGDMFLWPWGYSGSPGWISNWQYHHEVGYHWADAIFAATGKRYVVGNIADVLGNAFGASDDHMAGEQGVELSYTLELTGGGITGFDFPEAQIGALNRESFHGYRALGLYVAMAYGRQGRE